MRSLFILKAGIETDDLLLALEPEAASLYVRLLPKEMLITEDGAEFKPFLTGTKYMVLDAGGMNCNCCIQTTKIKSTLASVLS